MFREYVRINQKDEQLALEILFWKVMKCASVIHWLVKPILRIQKKWILVLFQ